ncbi:MAG: triose-phosphate isomerase [Puniceicoccales bacterium]|nr:triose-phosphate isomerase [Puniceicoccales bacterium]
MATKFRQPLIVGNWKMHRTPSEARVLLNNLKEKLLEVIGTAVVVCPPYTVLSVAADILEKTSIQVGAQNMCWEREGAFTGEISPHMLRDLYVTHVILGHSERRVHFHETLEQIRRKVLAALAGGLIPVLCVGETAEERESNQQNVAIDGQLLSALEGIDGETIGDVVIAYEPVWAIGTGKTATPTIAQEMHDHIRRFIRRRFGEEAAQTIHILYGGSMKAANAGELLSQPDIDGGLIGGASLDAAEFAAIVACAVRP